MNWDEQIIVFVSCGLLLHYADHVLLYVRTPHSHNIATALPCVEQQIESQTLTGTQGNAPDFVEVGEAGIAVDHAIRRQLAVQRSL